MRRLFFWLTNRHPEPAPERAQPRHEAQYTFTLQPPTPTVSLLARASSDALVGILNREIDHERDED